MKCNLEKHIIPFHGFIKSVLGDDDKAVTALKRGGYLLLRPHTLNLVPNISHMRENGVPQSRIEYLVWSQTRDLLMKHSDFCKVVKEVLELGVHPQKTLFFTAIHTMSKRFEFARERCVKVYKEFGCSEENIQQAFLKHPYCLILSERKLRSTLDFLVNKAGYRAKEVASCSSNLCLSLERRIILRYSVIRALSLMGLTDEKFPPSSVLIPAEGYFVNRFIHQYDEAAPQLLNVYQGKLDPFKSDCAPFCRSSK